MISKDMYTLLAALPRFHENEDGISYDDLCSKELLETGKLKDLLLEASHSDYNYIHKKQIRGEEDVLHNCSFTRSERGQVALEVYEQTEENQKAVNESLKISQKSLGIARVAMWAAIASAVAAIASLIKMFF